MLYKVRGKIWRQTEKEYLEGEKVNVDSDSLEKHSILEDSGARLRRFSRNKNESQESNMNLRLSSTIKTSD